MRDLILYLNQLKIDQMIVSVGLLMSRILGMIWLAPFLGGKLVPAQVKTGVALALGLILYPVVFNTGGLDALFNPTGLVYPFTLRLIGYLLKEIFVGIVLGFVIMTIWHAAEMVGRFVDTARGSAMGTALVPQMGSQASQLGSLYYQLLILIFLVMDGHLIFIDFFCRSYEQIPVTGFPRFDTGLWPFFELIIRITGDLFKHALTLSAPVMIAIFVTDACMGLFNKVAPQINVMFLMMPFKAMLGVLFSMFSLFLLVDKSQELMALTLQHILEVIQLLTPF